MDLEIIQTTIPLPQDVLVKKFTNPDIRFIVDYSESKVKDSGFLAYIDNVDLSCYVDKPSVDLIEHYIKSTHIVPINNLAFIHANLLLAVHTGFRAVYDHNMLQLISMEQLREIYERNKDVVDLQIDIFKSMPLYMTLNMSALYDERKEIIEQNGIKKIDDPKLFLKTGKSFVNLLRLNNFSSLFMPDNLTTESFEQMSYYSFLDDYLFNRQNVSLFIDQNHDTCAAICAEINEELS